MRNTREQRMAAMIKIFIVISGFRYRCERLLSGAAPDSRVLEDLIVRRHRFRSDHKRDCNFMQA
jgi:hypothetical protein